MTLNLSYIDNLAVPIVERQERINLYVLKKIAARIKEIGTLSPSDLYSIQQMIKTGADMTEIDNTLAEMSKLQSLEIERIINTAAAASYVDSKPFFEYRKMKFIPYEQNSYVKNIVNSVKNQTQSTYTNLNSTRAFMIRDKKNPSKRVPTSLSQTYISIVDEAIQASQQGQIDYNTAIRNSLEQLINSGIRSVTYYPDRGGVYTQRLDTAVRRTILDGIRAVNQGVQDEVGKQFGADGKEIMAHLNSASDHEPCQGHQFTNEEFEKIQNGKDFVDLQGNQYSGFERAIGTWNCKHFTFSIICGVTNPNYTNEQLEQFKKQNNVGYIAPNGKHLTMYECTQQQRKLETQIRRYRDALEIAKAAGDNVLADKYNAKIKSTITQYTNFSKACGLKPRYDKTLTNYNIK